MLYFGRHASAGAIPPPGYATGVDAFSQEVGKIYEFQR